MDFSEAHQAIDDLVEHAKRAHAEIDALGTKVSANAVVIAGSGDDQTDEYRPAVIVGVGGFIPLVVHLRGVEGANNRDLDVSQLSPRPLYLEAWHAAWDECKSRADMM